MQTKSWILLTKVSLDWQHYPGPMAANGTRVNLEIEELAIDDSDRIDLPASVNKKVFRRALYIAQNFSTYESKGTGAQLILSGPGLRSKTLADSDLRLGANIATDVMEGPLRKAFFQDGGILIDGKSGEVLAVCSQFYPQQPSEFVLSGHGTRHGVALDLAAQEDPPSVSIVRSEDGFVTVFSPCHLNPNKKPKCFRIRERPAARASLLMPRTPLIRFNDGKMEIPPEAKKSLEGLEPPLRVVALLGRTGKSTLAGHLVGDESVFPSAYRIGAVTEGINAAAVPHPKGGTLMVLDGEGFNDYFAPSRKEVATLCLLLASVVVSVDFDRMDDGIFSRMNELMACCELIAGPEKEKMEKPPNLFLVINGCRFCEEYDDQTLERALEWRDGSSETNRNSIRERIKAAFPGRSFCTVPWNGDRGYASAINTFRDRVVFEAQPLNSNDFPLDGSMFFQLLSTLVETCSDSGQIETQDIYETIVQTNMKAMADRAIASFGNHYPVGAGYRNELEGPEPFDYDTFLQPLRSKDNHRNSKVVQKLVKQSLQTMIAHAGDVSRENKRKGDEVVKRNYQTRRVLTGREYKKESSAWATACGAGTGVVTTGGPVAAATAVAAMPLFGFLVLGVGAVGGVAGAWGAATATEKYTMTSRYELQKRYMKMQVNGLRCFSDWTVVEEVIETKFVAEEEKWAKGEVSEQSEWCWDGKAEE